VLCDAQRNSCGKGQGTIIFTEQKKQTSLDFDISWNGDFTYELQLSTMLGNTVASVSSSSDSLWTIMVGETQFKTNPMHNVAIPGVSLSYDGTWYEFMQLLSGRCPCLCNNLGSPDSVNEQARSTSLIWRQVPCSQNKTMVVMHIENKSNIPIEIFFKNCVDTTQHISMTGFYGNHAKEIKCSRDNNNYFYLRYKTVKFFDSPAKRNMF
jgi:hypothetical protein